MTLYALPLDQNHTRPTQRQTRYPSSASVLKKRKRASSDDANKANNAAPSDDDESPALTQTSLSAALTNPLSLGPEDILQYRTAGLGLDRELPGVTEGDFPHRPLGWRQRTGRHVDADGYKGEMGDEDDDGGDDENAQGKVPRRFGKAHLRTRHLSVLTAVVQRCLAEGDLERAGRAWALLVRAQVGGVPVELRESGYWGVGAEILVRAGEKKVRGSRGLDGRIIGEKARVEAKLGGNPSGGLTSGLHGKGEGGNEDSRVVDDEEDDRYGVVADETQWGTAAGRERAKEYFERLILQYPYRRQFHDSINALDFWPAMLSCQIYGIQQEQTEATAELQRLSTDPDFNPSGDEADDSANDDDMLLHSFDGEAYLAAQDRKEQRRARRTEEYLWRRREHVRVKALNAAEQIATRMDEIMTLPPYSDSHVLLRLRGMLALYVGDLSVPDPEDSSDPAGKDERGGGGNRRAQRENARRQEMGRRNGLRRRDVEVRRARTLFEKVKELAGDGGDMNEVLARVGDAEGGGEGSVYSDGSG